MKIKIKNELEYAIKDKEIHSIIFWTGRMYSNYYGLIPEVIVV